MALDFFKKILGQGEKKPEANEEKKDLNESESSKYKNIRKAARVKPSSIQNVIFHMKEPTELGSITICNISATGIGFFRGDIPWPNQGERVRGELIFKEQRCEVEGEVVHSTGEIVGVHLDGDTENYRKTFSRLFRVEIAAARMSQVRSDMLAPSELGTPFLFMGGDNCDLHYVADGDQVTKFTLTLFGVHLECGTDGKIHASEVVGDQIWAGVGVKGPDFTRSKEEGHEALVESSIRFLENVDGISPAHLKSIVGKLQDFLKSLKKG